VTSWTQVAVGVSRVVGGFYHSLNISNNGILRATGYSNYGQLGLGDTTNRTSWTLTAG